MSGIEALLREQSGVVARRQVLALGSDDAYIERRLRRRDWARLHRGVYVDHTGDPTWLQRAWAAVLCYSPAALCAASALVVTGVRTTGEPATSKAAIHVAVDQSRRVDRIDGVCVHRVTNLAGVVQPNRLPARVRLEHALLDVASAAPDDAASIAVLADACQTGHTTAARLLATLRLRTRLSRRRFLLSVLHDVSTGAHSVLEHTALSPATPPSLVRVERPHGLPTVKRQRRVRIGRSPAYRDVEYLHFRTVVELDGSLGHTFTEDGWDDLDRDIDSVVAGDVTLRLGWRQVLCACRAAITVGRLLHARGWQGSLRPCGPGCPVSSRGGDPT